MAVKITSIDEAVEDNGLKILVHGLAGAGKTVLCATTGSPTLILNVEGGLLSIVGAPDYIHTAKIESISDLDEIYHMLKKQRADDEQFYQWAAIDSISDVAETILKNELEKCNDPRKSYPAFQAEVTRLMKAFRDLEGYNIIMTSKQDLVKDDYTGITLRVPAMPGNKLGPTVPYLFDEVFALRVEKDEEGEDYRVIQTSRDIMFEAKDRSGKLNMFEKPSLKHILKKIHGEAVVEVEMKVKTKKAKPDEKTSGEKGEPDEACDIPWFHEASETVGIATKTEFDKMMSNGDEIAEISKDQYDQAVSNGATVAE